MFNPEDFRARKVDIIKHFERKGYKYDTITEYCVLAGIPITVVCGFIIEEKPEHAEMCRGKIRELNAFYGVK
jgi:hypothetical protein